LKRNYADTVSSLSADGNGIVLSRSISLLWSLSAETFCGTVCCLLVVVAVFLSI